MGSLLSSMVRGEQPAAVAAQSWSDRASFETTKRLLAEVVNEGLAGATLETSESTKQQRLILQRNQSSSLKSERWVEVNLRPGTYTGIQGGKVVSLVRAESLQPPVTLGDTTLGKRQELDPEIILEFMSSWIVGDDVDEILLRAIGKELKNSSNNQGRSSRACQFCSLGERYIY